MFILVNEVVDVVLKTSRVRGVSSDNVKFFVEDIGSELITIYFNDSTASIKVTNDSTYLANKLNSGKE